MVGMLRTRRSLPPALPGAGVGACPLFPREVAGEVRANAEVSPALQR